MTDAIAHTGMPSRPELVAMAIGRLDTAGIRSQMLELDGATLRDLCIRLVDRAVSVAMAHDWLNKELGGDEENQVVDDNAVYRFSKHFRRLYDQVRSEVARSVMRSKVLGADDATIRNMTRAAQHMLIEAATERMLDRDVEEIDPKELNTLALVVRRAQATQVAQDALEISKREAEQRAEKLATEIERLKLDLDQRRRAIESAKKIVETKADATDGRMTKADILDVLDKAMKGEM
ncbi:MAG: DUF3486 family protein [Planctomycetes bacterium]|nr:DUF3486 family protein [Planctomycetota bacterium]